MFAIPEKDFLLDRNFVDFAKSLRNSGHVGFADEPPPTGPDNSTSAQGPTQLGPIQMRIQGEFLQFFFPSPHEAALFPSAVIAKNMCFLHSHVIDFLF